MIDLTPLDVRKKKGDFSRGLRGYESGAVDDFLDLVAERMDELVRENATLKERLSHLTEALSGYRDRERALNEALVTAQQMREEMRSQAAREAELAVHEARGEAERLMRESRALVETEREALRRARAERLRFMRNFRAFVERQLSDIDQEEAHLRAAAEPQGGAE